MSKITNPSNNDYWVLVVPPALPGPTGATSPAGTTGLTALLITTRPRGSHDDHRHDRRDARVEGSSEGAS